jgi:hypothetical protein
LQIPLKEGIVGESKAERIGGEREGDFTDNFIMCPSTSIQGMSL